MRFVAALDTRIYGVPYSQGAEVNTLGWSRKQMLQFLGNGIIQASSLTVGAITDSLGFEGNGVTYEINEEGVFVVTVDPALAGLSDVDLTVPPEDQQALVWDEASSSWMAGDIAAALSELTDVDVTTVPPVDLSPLQYDTATGKWVPGPVHVHAPDAELRDRSTHTGEQAISTITDLQTTLDDLLASGGIFKGAWYGFYASDAVLDSQVITSAGDLAGIGGSTTGPVSYPAPDAAGTPPAQANVLQVGTPSSGAGFFNLTVPVGVTKVRYRVRCWLNGTWTTNQELRVGGAVTNTYGFLNWQWIEKAVTSGVVIGLNNQGSFGTWWGYWQVAEVELVGPQPKLWAEGDYVTHNNSLWRSTADDNTTTPGADGASWIQEVGGGSSGGGAATRDDSCSIYRTAALSSGTGVGVTTQLLFDARSFDKSSAVDMWSSGAPSQITIKTTGTYLITSQMTFEGPATSWVNLEIRVNGTGRKANFTTTPGSGDWPSYAATGVLALNAGDVVTVWYENRNAARPIVVGAAYTFLDVTRVGLSGAGGGAGGLAAYWVRRVNLPLSTLVDWTVGNGTWVTTTGQIEQTSTAASPRRLIYNTPIDTKAAVVEVELKAASPSGLHQAGVIIGSPGGDATNGLGIQLHRPNNAAAEWTHVTVEEEGITNVASIALTAPVPNTGYVKLRAEVDGDTVSIYVNDVFVATTRDIGKRGIAAKQIGLLCYGADVTFRNLKVWTPVGATEAGVGQPLLSGTTSVDEFGADALDASWVRADGTGAVVGSVSWAQGAGGLSAKHTSAADTASRFHALLRPIGTAMADGDAFETSMLLFGQERTQYTMGGLVLSDTATYGAGTQVITLNFITSTGITNDTRPATGFLIGTASTAVNTLEGCLHLTRLVKLAGNLWRCDVSPDGIQWLSSGTITLSFTPTFVGFLSSNWGTAVQGIVRYEYLRRVSGVT